MNQSNCWIYLGPFGYSRSGVAYGRYSGENAHRVSYRSFVGPIRKGLTVDHLCRNPLCINPRHLEAVTLEENILRGFSPTALNGRKTHCPGGHPYIYLPSGIRGCRLCAAIYARKYRKANKAMLKEKRHKAYLLQTAQYAKEEGK